MNYLAHLFLARPTADSHFGNLLGDFRRGVDISRYGRAVQLGLKNHYEVDKLRIVTTVFWLQKNCLIKAAGDLRLWR